MKRYTAAQARQHLADLLDAAERGHQVVIERRGVRFRVEAQRPTRRRSTQPSLIEFVDPAVAAGSWTWTWGPGGLRFSARRRRR